MRVGMLVDMYTPHVSGVTNYVSTYKRALEARGHEVWVVTFGNTDYPDEEERVLRSPGIPWGRTGWHLGLGYSREAREIVAGLDVAHVHNPFLSGELSSRICRPLGIPIVFTNHTRYDMYADVYARFVPRAVRQGFVRWGMRRFLSAADAILAPSERIAGWLRSCGYAEEPVVLPNAVDVRRFAEPDGVPLTKRDLGFEDDDVVAVYLGRVGHEKQMLELADAFASARAACPPLRLLVLGDGPAMGDFKRRLAELGVTDSVVLRGLVYPAEVPIHLPAGDFFVTASVTETYPLVLIEAMAAGLPAVGVDSPGVGEIISHEVNGLLAGDHGSLGDAIARMACDPALRERLALSAARDAWRDDIGARVDELLRIYADAMERRRGRR